MEQENFSQNKIEQNIIFAYFDQVMPKQKGKFLDIGCFNGETFSNTRGLFLYRDWDGVFVEAEAQSFTRTFDRYLKDPNRATLINATVCLEEHLGRNLISFSSAPDTATSTVGSVDSLSSWGFDKFNENGEKYLPRVTYTARVGMKEILETFGPFDMIKIDVEGISAALALQDWFNPKDYGCKLLLVEPDRMDVLLNQKFEGLGYRLLANTGDSVIYGV